MCHQIFMLIRSAIVLPTRCFAKMCNNVVTTICENPPIKLIAGAAILSPFPTKKKNKRNKKKTLCKCSDAFCDDLTNSLKWLTLFRDKSSENFAGGEEINQHSTTAVMLIDCEKVQKLQVCQKNRNSARSFKSLLCSLILSPFNHKSAKSTVA